MAQYTIRSDRRDAIAIALKETDIPTAIYCQIPMHLLSAYGQYGSVNRSCLVAERLAQRVLSLPMHPNLEHAMIGLICEIVRRAA